MDERGQYQCTCSALREQLRYLSDVANIGWRMVMLTRRWYSIVLALSNLWLLENKIWGFCGDLRSLSCVSILAVWDMIELLSLAVSASLVFGVRLTTSLHPYAAMSVRD